MIDVHATSNFTPDYILHLGFDPVEKRADFIAGEYRRLSL